MTHSGEIFLPTAFFFCFRLISKKKHFFLSVQPKKHIKMEREKENKREFITMTKYSNCSAEEKYIQLIRIDFLLVGMTFFLT